MHHRVHAASAVVPTATHEAALVRIAEGLEDPLFGIISAERVQLCPQHRGYIGEEMIERLKTAHPGTEFRLHAAPKLTGVRKRHVYGSNLPANDDWVDRLVALTDLMNPRGYSIHAGLRSESSLGAMIDNVRRLEDRMKTRVSVEGLYPARDNMWLMSSWREYEAVALSGLGFALDMSHLNIVARRHGREDGLVRDMLAMPNCIEVHVSHNDGRADSHRKMDPAETPWWFDMLCHANDDADFFYEGILVMPSR